MVATRVLTFDGHPVYDTVVPRGWSHYLATTKARLSSFGEECSPLGIAGLADDCELWASPLVTVLDIVWLWI